MKTLLIALAFLASFSTSAMAKEEISIDALDKVANSRTTAENIDILWKDINEPIVNYYPEQGLTIVASKQGTLIISDDQNKSDRATFFPLLPSEETKSMEKYNTCGSEVNSYNFAISALHNICAQNSQSQSCVNAKELDNSAAQELLNCFQMHY